MLVDDRLCGVQFSQVVYVPLQVSELMVELTKYEIENEVVDRGRHFLNTLQVCTFDLLLPPPQSLLDLSRGVLIKTVAQFKGWNAPKWKHDLD